MTDALRGQWNSRGYASLYRKAAEPAGDPLADVVVHLVEVPGRHPVPERNAVSHHKAQGFSPRVLTPLRGQRLVIANDDPYDHQLRSDSKRNTPFNSRLKAGGPPLIYRTQHTEEFTISCSMHLKSACHVLVLQNPHFSRLGKDGSFRLKELPPGTYELRAWHPDFAPVSTRVTVLARREVAVNLIFEKVRYAP